MGTAGQQFLRLIEKLAPVFFNLAWINSRNDSLCQNEQIVEKESKFESTQKLHFRCPYKFDSITGVL